MENEHYTLEQILDAVSVKKGNSVKKRLLFDQGKVGGIALKWVLLLFIALPIVLYAGIFNPAIFGMLGIAQAVVFFIVFLSMLMIIIFVLSFINNNAVLRRVKNSWESYFPGIDIKYIFGSNSSPYRDFFQYYSEAVNKGISGKALHQYLKESFVKMAEENKEMISAMERTK
jgi:hypothetical protein